ncbi:MAG: bifunctional salicylyl-CoA 5-hydroxylase/oxidoreductase [Gemmatimonadetes bacterium]|nr:bifunctional salicylyl-CoA 5-hydroxylase/oxidoreductase [Gemmatimonadota bacterium]
MRVAVLGGGPAGLYFSLLLKQARPDVEIEGFERNAPDDTFGWGVVFSDQTLENFRQADAPTYEAITDAFAHWDDIDIHVRGRTITSSGHGFSGIARRDLLGILQRRAAALGVTWHYQSEMADEDALRTRPNPPDLIVAADGVNSVVRRRHAAAFGATVDQRTNRYIWLGTTLPFDAFTFIILENAFGTFQVHAYRFTEGLSTFIVECDEASWFAAGFDQMDAAQTMATCEAWFAPWLKGHRLQHNSTVHRVRDPWGTFLRVNCEQWRHGNVVLLGDAAHTAHFSIGSGTKLAMEDAIALAREVARVPAGAAGTSAELTQAIDRYQEERRVEVLRIQNAARNSMEWFEHVKRYVNLEPEQFAYSLLTRSQRVSHENLRLRDGAYLAGVERWFASRAEREAPRPRPEPPTRPRKTSGEQRAVERAPAPMFTPFRLRQLTLENRIVVSPMDMYSATDGLPNDFHLVHYGARALGGAGLVMTEMTCVSPEGRITPGCTGMYTEEQAEAWRRITAFTHQWSRAKICLQLGHAGRKGSTRLGLEGTDIPLEEGNWPLLAPSAQPHRPYMQVPRAMTRADMDQVVHEFARAARLAIAADFDMLELHCAHGYLLSSFITPLGNHRTDEYGGSLANRLRFPLEVFHAVREAWPQERPLSVRISATDWATGGVDAAEAVEIARAFSDAGADIMHISTGQTTPEAKPVYGRMYQTPFSDRIRNELGVKTIAVGAITDPDQVNSILAAGRADLCALARPHLANPAWTLQAAAQQGYREQHWPWQYLSGKDQMERLLERAKGGG